MNKVRVLRAETNYKLEKAINDFAKNHEIVNVSLTVSVVENYIEYYAAVVYKEG